jgi:putative membrane protein
MLVLAGALAAAAMVIPGISGAFFLLVIGMYRTILQAVSDLNIVFLAPFAIGVIAGLFTGAAFIRWLLVKAPQETYGAVLGLVAGSIVLLLPKGIFGEGITIIFSITALLAGSAISYFSSAKKN